MANGQSVSNPHLSTLPSMHFTTYLADNKLISVADITD